MPTTISIAMSSESERIIIELLLKAYRTTGFDEDIGVRVIPRQDHLGWLSDSDVADRRQFREGYVSGLKDGVLAIDVDNFKRRILNNPERVTIGNSGGLHIARFSSPFHEAGRQLARDTLTSLRRQIWEETRAVSKKHFKSDQENYRRKNLLVPVSELEKRLVDAPHLQAIIFLQNRWKSESIMDISIRQTDAHSQSSEDSE